MGRKKPGARTLTSGRGETTDHGIYSETRLPDGSGRILPSYNQIVQRAVMAGLGEGDAVDSLLKLQRDLRELIRANVIDPRNTGRNEWMTMRVDLGDGTRDYKVACERELGIEQAQSALEWIDRVIPPVGESVGVEVIEAFIFGVRAGIEIERIEVLKHEADALKGKRQADRIASINAGRRSAATERQLRRRTAVAAEIEHQLATGQRMNYGKACQAVADDEGLESSQCVIDDVPNIWTKRKTASR